MRKMTIKITSEKDTTENDPKATIRFVAYDLDQQNHQPEICHSESFYDKEKDNMIKMDYYKLREETFQEFMDILAEEIRNKLFV